MVLPPCHPNERRVGHPEVLEAVDVQFGTRQVTGHDLKSDKRPKSGGITDPRHLDTGVLTSSR